MVKEKQDSFEIVNIATATEPRIQNNETKEMYTLTEAVCNILNEIKELKKAVG